MQDASTIIIFTVRNREERFNPCNPYDPCKNSKSNRRRHARLVSLYLSSFAGFLSLVINARGQTSGCARSYTYTRARIRKKLGDFVRQYPSRKPSDLFRKPLCIYMRAASVQRSGSNACGSMRIRLSFFAGSVGRWVARLQGTRLSQLELELAGKESQEHRGAKEEGGGRVQSKRTGGGEETAKENREPCREERETAREPRVDELC